MRESTQAVKTNSDGIGSKKNVNDQVLSSIIRKVDIDGKAKCVICDKLINYSSRGKVAINDHCMTSDHIKRSKTIKILVFNPNNNAFGNMEK